MKAGTPPRLTDGLLFLDGFTIEDADAHLAGEDEEQARRFGWFPARSTPESVRGAIERWHGDWSTEGPTRAFATRVGGTLVGGCELRPRAGHFCELAYWVFAGERRKGYATRIATLAVEFAFGPLDATAVELHIEPDNAASRRVAENTGFTLTGKTTERIESGAERTMLVYTRTRTAPG